MVNLPFFDNKSVSAVRRTVFEVSFGSGSADDWQQAIVSIAMEAGLGPSVDAVEVTLASGEQGPSIAVGDTGSLSLGYANSATALVFTGQIEDVRYSIHGTTHITATNGAAALAKLRVNQSYEGQSAGDIVNDLIGRVGVGAGTVENGADFPFYVVDDRRSVYEHIAALAKKSGYLAYFNPEGELNFAPFAAGQPVQTFTYGEDILSLQVTDAAPIVGSVEIVGEGAAGSQGQEAWSWLLKDPASVTGSTGDGGPERKIQDASLRSSDAAQSAADSLANAAGLMKLTGKILVPGAPAVVVGSAVEIADVPQEALNGLGLVHRVRHRLSKRLGFTTFIVFSKTSDGGLGGLL